MRANIKGISLIEFLVMVILISTLVLAYFNFRDELAKSNKVSSSNISAIDSVYFAALDEICLDLRLAHRKPQGRALSTKKLESNGRIAIDGIDFKFEYIIDENGRLIKLYGKNRRALAEQVLSLTARGLGRETIVLTLLARPPGKDNGSDMKVHSYSRVVTVNSRLG